MPASKTKTAKTARIPKIAAVVSLTYERGWFGAEPDPVKVRKGDTLSFTYTTDLSDPKIEIKLDKEFFEPATFKNGDPPVTVIKTGYSEYHCQFSGTSDGKLVNWTSTGGEGASVDPRDN
jgi:hypothetical protein